MFHGKCKAVTFSYDDGVTQDIRLVELLNQYGLKGTFNINSELLGQRETLVRQGVTVNHDKVNPDQIQEVYQGHEIAVHTLTHPNLTELSEQEIVRQVEEDKKNLSALAGYEVVGMAYPCGGVNHDDRVAEVISQNTSMRYARTITSSYSFELQTDLLQFDPSVYHMEWEKMFALGEKFVAMKPNHPQLFYIWGHSYEFDVSNTWSRFEEFCKLISGREDIFYGTNREVLL